MAYCNSGLEFRSNKRNVFRRYVVIGIGMKIVIVLDFYKESLFVSEVA